MKELISNKVAEVSEYLPKDKSGAPIVPVDLSLILEKYNIGLRAVAFNEQDVAGAFDRNKRCIYVNDTDPKTRKIFTVAHELGHYFLHQDVVGTFCFARGRRAIVMDIAT